ncbi:histidine kinase N-terminal 7TM domain-containing protein [Intestinimonas massiliensis (ex Afouda et al. 2020)]|uniref:Histidine kinase N-terminal 7TM region domain-containing protein n=1 Tax=Intestinimonas massiliensis (ex Afouda et al. 2020) TaxID=1673721 RepID=A0ABS9M908_9FIRM|nr:histidine kinase N-terminal 7TM domain-containing protein [Intestinimonas massiliensis (ex Afouda et al. 2020)]MCG4527298.1 hypothetical protein [Intestinimonas massiliensis (ex Afouda et al. 2020)]
MKKTVIFLLLCLFLTGCAAEEAEHSLIANLDLFSPYAETVLQTVPDYELRAQTDGLYTELSQGNAAACFDVQAIPAMEQGVGRYWYPHCLATVVIAVDRAQTDADISRWRDLLDAGAVVGMTTDAPQNRLILGAMSYGLEGREYTKSEALDLLERLYSQGELRLDDQMAPIQLCFDYQAAAWNRAGQNWEIIVPEEGTLSFDLGLLSDTPLEFERGLDETLLAAGLPLADGRRPDGYPDNRAYRDAVHPEDFARLLSVTEDTDRDIRRSVCHTRLYSSADHREHTLAALLVSAMAIFWMGTVSQRILRRDIRRTAALVGWLVVGWIFLRLLKYQIFEICLLTRLCWYGYYVFQLALPLAMLRLADIVDKPEDAKRLLRPIWWPMAAYILSVLLIFTNDLHQMVFRFDLSGDWSHDYQYGPGYFVVLLISLVFLLAAIVLLFRKNRHSRYLGARVFPVLFIAAILSYILGYLFNIPLFRDSDYTITICVLAMLFFESFLHTGMIPVNVRYGPLFAAAPLNLQLLDEEGQTVLAANGASPIPKSVWRRLRADMSRPLLRDRDTLLHATPIRGGMVVWQEDVSALNRVRQEIQTSSARLEAANALLREESEAKRRLLAAEAKAELYDELEREIPRRVSVLARLIQSLPQAEDHQRQTAYITLCLCHIKRRYNLFFLTRQSEPVLGDELSIYLDELAELAGYAGVKVLVRCGLHSQMAVRTASLCYDFCFESLSWAVRENCSTMLGYLEREDTELAFKLLPACSPDNWRFSQEFQDAVAAARGRITHKNLDDTAGVWLTIPLGGEDCG